MRCRKCGKEVRDGAKFCPYCGASASEAVPQEIKKKKGKTGLIISLILALIVLGVATGLVLHSVMSRKGAEKTSVETAEDGWGSGKSSEKSKKDKSSDGDEKDRETETEKPEEIETKQKSRETESQSEEAVSGELLWQNEYSVGANVLNVAQKGKIAEAIQKSYGETAVIAAVFPDAELQDGSLWAEGYVLKSQDGLGYGEPYYFVAELGFKDDGGTLGYNLNDFSSSETYISDVFSNVSASSVYQGYDSYNYSQYNVLDWDDDSAWVEGASGYGIGEWIELSDTMEHLVYGICVKNGYIKSEKTRLNNGQVKDCTLSFSDGSQLKATLRSYGTEKGNYSDVIVFDEPVMTSYVRLTIDSVYEAQDYTDFSTNTTSPASEDTCITELKVLVDYY